MENIVEEWRDVVGFEGFYKVSNLGRVKALKRQYVSGKKYSIVKYSDEKILNTSHRRKYLKVHFNINGKGFDRAIHRVVAQAFPEICGKWFEGCVINHKDCNPENNRADNLEVCTTVYNNHYNNRYDKVSKKLCNRSDISKPVIQYTREWKKVATHPSAAEGARQIGLHSASHILESCRYYDSGQNQKIKTAGGFIWRFA